MRYFFEISYNGKNYAGWQSQANATGIQAVVEDTLSKMFRTEVKIVGSGRTDTGVHCEQQFFHCDIEKPFETESLIQKVNSFLPRDIAIQSIRRVKDDASARYDAVERTYHYRITRKKNPFRNELAWHYFKTVDVQTMNTAAALLVGEHDFECFSKVKTDVNHFLCDIKKASWRDDGDGLEFTITANRFLRGMVRAVVGTLLDVGTGKTTVKEFQAIIQSHDRKKAGANVPPYGLYLSKVKYPPSMFVKEI
ncbi:tRNA pseudouridine(38-40) synthase TruA [Chryseolinea lacunae]|uniref:tRNA pseudouridine synthase A n=1 Tax=Chryseolinea lacunae TaxID=2801331 RepID=A0ABS1KQR5_9BACT|nr:tRNA pseudouridine(38-40) synthase TruA [Chryseolinea lacunae]MBL0741587.1 tRNA pseudouridine(38-40) synthase TruA [Chryseolinea lacunae]